MNKYLFFIVKNNSIDIPSRPLSRLDAEETLKSTKICANFDAILLNWLSE